MTDTPPPEAAAPATTPEPLVDTTPATPERTAVTYGILFLVLASLVTYFVLHATR